MITLLTFEANRLMGPYVSGALGNLAPVFAVAAGVIVLGEALEALQWVAVIAIIAGVTSMSVRRTWHGGAWRGMAALDDCIAAWRCFMPGPGTAGAEDRSRLVA